MIQDFQQTTVASIGLDYLSVLASPANRVAVPPRPVASGDSLSADGTPVSPVPVPRPEPIYCVMQVAFAPRTPAPPRKQLSRTSVLARVSYEGNVFGEGANK